LPLLNDDKNWATLYIGGFFHTWGNRSCAPNFLFYFFHPKEYTS